jgi:hypothetical protein
MRNPEIEPNTSRDDLLRVAANQITRQTDGVKSPKVSKHLYPNWHNGEGFPKRPRGAQLSGPCVKQYQRRCVRTQGCSGGACES